MDKARRGTLVAALPPPRFIVLEGGDGSGKTTIRQIIFDTVCSFGRPALTLAGVSWTDPGSAEVITKAKYFKQSYPSAILLEAYVQDRRRLCAEFIEPMRRTRDVVSDRYLYSDIVYNHLLYALPLGATVEAYKSAALSQPDCVIFLDTPPEIAVERLNARSRSINHWETLEKQQRIYEGLNRLIETNPLGWTTQVARIDNRRPPKAVANEVIALLFGPEGVILPGGASK